MSTIKVDTIATRTGSGNITLSNNVASLTSAGAISGTNLTASGTLAVTGLTTMSGNASVTGDTATITLTDSSSHSANTGPAISFFSNDSGGTSREVAKIVGESHSGANEGNLALQTRNGGTLETKWKVFKNGNLLPSNTDYGIYLGVTAASGDANLLNDYEEGTFTPTLVDSGDDLSTNYTFQAGQYTKVGNKVTFALRINSNSHDSDGDQLYIGGLPFAVNFTNTSNRSYVQVDGNGFNLDAGSGYYKLVGQLTNTNQSITLLQQGDNNAQNNFRANSLQQTKEVYVTGTYFTNS